jgi:Ca-activated chloride channel family protein
MSWAEPQWAGAFLIVAALGLLIAWASRQHEARLAAIFRGDLLRRVFPPAVRRRRRASDLLTLLGLAFTVLALIEPRFGKELREVPTEGVDLIVAIDLSRSMDAEDVDPSRMERARREILDLLDLLEGDRVGLVIFAGGAYPRMPLTADHKALRMLVGELDTRTFQAQGSELGAAIREAIKLFGEPDATAGRAVLVLTDGEAHDPADALAAASEAAEAHVTVYGIVVGLEPSPIPNGDGTFLVDPTTGTQVSTAPTFELLTDIARLTGGAVVQSVASQEDVERLYRDEIRGRLRTRISKVTQRERWNTAFQWPLGAGLGMLLLGAWLGDGRRAAVLLTLLFFALPVRAETRLAGDEAYRSGQFQEAVRIFTELSLEQPDDPDLLGRLGAARYRAGDYDGAARAFERRSELTQDADDAYNAANASYRAGRFDRALDLYDRTLSTEPNHPGATANRQLLLQEIEERRQEQQQRQQQQQPEPSEGPQGEQPPANDGAAQEQPPEPGSEQQPSNQASEGQPPEDAQQQGEQAEQQGGQPQQGDGEPMAEPEQDGTRGEDGEPTDQSLDELLPDGGSGEPGEETEGDPNDPNQPGGEGGTPTDEVTAEQADRTLEAVEEGRPRVYIPGDRGGKPW